MSFPFLEIPLKTRRKDGPLHQNCEDDRSLRSLFLSELEFVDVLYVGLSSKHAPLAWPS